MSNGLFGTDGIRARAGEFPLDSQTVVAIGQAVGEKLGGTIVIGQDTRISSPWIFNLLREGISKTGATIEDAGVIPTPAIALLTKEHHYAGGIVISASHNPYEDNGIKVFSSDGTKLKDADEEEIERTVYELLDNDPLRASRAVPLSKGDTGGRVQSVPLEKGDSRHDRSECEPDRAKQVSKAAGGHFARTYQELLLSRFPPGQWLKGTRILVDCANGAMSHVAPDLLRRLGANVTVIHASPSGTNINENCGAVHLHALTSAMKDTSADFGVAFDGDGDRSLFVSRSGRLIDGDAVLLTMARRLKQAGRLNPPTVVGTLMTNFSLEKMLAAEGIGLTRVAVGDRYIFEEMQRGGGPLGGEPSGHIIFPDFGLSGDGLLTTLKVAEAIVSDHASFDDLTRDWIEAPQLLKNVRVRHKVALETFPEIQAKVSEVHHKLHGCGRLVIRYSGTEPLLRVMIESDDAAKNERLMEELLDVIRRNIDIG